MFYRKSLIPFATLIGLTSIAFAGPGSTGGGDIQCDNLIQDLSFQDPNGNLESWLQNGGPEKQNPKLDLSSSRNPGTGKPYTSAEYEKAMIAIINNFRKAPDINCVKPGDRGYPVDVNDTSKICKTFVDKKGVHMTCDRELFMALSSDEQIEQNHHEFAINIPGLEPDTGSISTYKISRQLSGSIADVTERRLVVSAESTTPSATFTANYCDLTYSEDESLDATISLMCTNPADNLSVSAWSPAGKREEYQNILTHLRSLGYSPIRGFATTEVDIRVAENRIFQKGESPSDQAKAHVLITRTANYHFPAFTQDASNTEYRYQRLDNDGSNAFLGDQWNDTGASNVHNFFDYVKQHNLSYRGEINFDGSPMTKYILIEN